jgi:non-specific serine/threonine protein kinase/serine/threonine-protein kinase
MTAGERWTRMWDLFHAAAELADDARRPWLEHETGGDEALVREVLQLLGSHAAAGTFLEPAATAPAGLAASGITPLGDCIGPYRVKERIGEGGFAEVWAAEQLQPVQRPVALKVLKAGMDSQSVVQRFAAEQRTLARLQHPGIATVFDAGTTPDGRPFLAMELVHGVPLLRYCDEHRLGLPARLSLLQQVCEAVHHAHQKAVVHRDLKPSNILVTDVDGHPRVKVIDFGIAKLLDGQADFTRSGLFVGTPEYMSPEQAAGEDLDTRSDVHALGIVLYELLVGVRPFQARAGDLAGALQMQRLLLAAEPARPSQQVTASVDAGAVARARQIATPQALAGRLRGELDWIVLKALERDRTRRYASPADLAADLGRHLRHEPVLAGPPSAVYRLRKFVRRHPTAVAGAIALALALPAFGLHLVAVAATERSLRQDADAGRQAAESSLRVANGVNEFFAREILAATNPARTTDRAITVREALDAAAAVVGERFATEPLLEAAIRQTIGDTYRSLGEFELALPHAERAVDLWVRTVGQADSRALAASTMLANLYSRTGRLEDAVAIHRRAFEERRRVFGPDHLETLRCAINLGAAECSAGRPKEGEPLLRAVIADLERVAGADAEETILAVQHLASAMMRLERHEEAVQLLERALERHRRVLDPGHPVTLAAKGDLARALTHLGRTAEAEPLLLEIVDGMERRLGADHVESVFARMNLGWYYVECQRIAEAEPILLAGARRVRELLGDDHPQSFSAASHVGSLYSLSQREALAEPYYAFAADGGVRVLPETDWTRGFYLLNHGRTLHRIGRSQDALPRLREAFRILHAVLGTHARSIEALFELATVEEATGNTEAAAALRARLKPRGDRRAPQRRAGGRRRQALVGLGADAGPAGFRRARKNAGVPSSRPATSVRTTHSDRWGIAVG